MADQDYIASGFNAFLSRSIDNGPTVNLDSVTPPNNTLAFDRTQINGMLGDIFTIGNIKLNGSEGTIILSDGTNDRVLIGFQSDGF